MSTMSKTPQNRVSRIAGPSKLPSRILRPTFGNKSVTNFVSSAKLAEKKKESTRSQQHSEVTSNSPFHNSTANRSDDIEEVTHCSDKSSVDCNGNKKDCEQKKYFVAQNSTVSSNTQRTNNLLSNNAKYYEMQKASTVNSLDRGTDKKTPDTPSDVQSLKPTATVVVGSTVPNYRSMKPGYFLQKVSAIKSSQKKSDEHTEKLSSQGKNVSSSLTRYSAVQRKANSHEVDNKSKFGYKFDGNTIAPNDDAKTLTDQRNRTTASSKLIQSKTDSQENMKDPHFSPVTRNSYSTRAEKRKKYLELKNPVSNVSSHDTTSSNTQLPFSFQKQHAINDVSCEENSSDSQTTRRPYLRKPQLRNAKIARPVVRPKKIASPITAKPYEVKKPDHPTEQNTTTVKPRPPSDIDANIIAEFLNEDHSDIADIKSNAQNFSDSDKLAGRSSDEQFADSVASEESGYSSVTSNVYLDIRTNGIVEDSIVSSTTSDKHTSERDTETFGAIQNGQSSYSLSDVLSTELSNDEDEEKDAENMRYCSYIASEDIITFGQYRLQAEGNYSPEEKYGVSEACQIRTSSGSESDITALREKQVSPDCENASNSSAETVIHNTRSPQPCLQNDSSENQKDDNKKDAKFCYTVTDIEQQEVPSSHSVDEVFDEDDTKSKDDFLNNKRRSDFQFFSASDDTLFMPAAKTPETSNKPGTPSSNSTSKAKKRKTDLLIMSPLIIEETNDKEQSEIVDAKTKIKEKKNLFDEVDSVENNGNHLSDENDERDESLSEFIDLPSLHESALMIDCNSTLEDGDVSSSEDEAEVFDSKTEKQKKATPNVSTPQTDVINKLLCQGLNGIVSSEKMNARSMTLTNGCHADLANATTPLKSRSSVEDNHRTRDDLNSIYRLELGVMKMSLIELYKTLELEEAQKEKQVEENKRLQIKNQKLTKMVESLTKEVTSLKTSKLLPVSNSKETQVDVQVVDASTDTEPSQDKTQSASSSHWYHSEVSTEVESNIKEASVEIKYLKDLRGDFDKRIRDTELRLNSALQLLHR